MFKTLDIEKLLQHYQFKQIKHHGNFIRACCKIHDGNNPTAFVINKETGLWFCHTGDCGGGDVFTLVQKMEDVDFPTATRWVAAFFDVDINNLHIQRKTNYLQELQNFINTVKIKKTPQFSPFKINSEIKEVVKYRNFKEKTLRHFAVGYVKQIALQKHNGEKYTLYHRLVFPLVFNTTTIGASLRKINPQDYPKWSHQPVQLKVKKLLYNYDYTKNNNSIIICEGINDVLAFHEIDLPAVAIFGSHISKEQYRLLLKTGADLVFAFDGDKAGKIATQRAIKLFKNKANLSIIHFNEQEDPASIERKVLSDRYVNRLQSTQRWHCLLSNRR